MRIHCFLLLAILLATLLPVQLLAQATPQWRADAPSALGGLSLSPNGALLAGWGRGGGMYIWRMADGKQVATLAPGRVTCATWSADGTRLAAGTKEGNIAIWFTATFQTAQFVRGHTQAVTGIVFLPDGVLASSGNEGGLLFWNTETGILKKALVQEKPITGLAWHEETSRLLAMQANSRILMTNTHIYVWKEVLLPGQNEYTQALPGCNNPLYFVSADGSTVQQWTGSTTSIPDVWTQVPGAMAALPPSLCKDCLLATTGKAVFLWQAGTTRQLQYGNYTLALPVPAADRLVMVQGTKTIEVFPLSPLIK